MTLVGPLPMIKLRDSRGQIWQITMQDCRKRRARVYRGRIGDETVDMLLTVTTPAEYGGEDLVVPPFPSWKPDVVFDGVRDRWITWVDLQSQPL